MTDYDVLVIGSGAAGQQVASDCAKAGRSVAVVDRLPFGGTCSLRGCLPKKLLLAASEAASRSEGLAGQGITGACQIDWQAAMRRKSSFVEDTPDKTLAWMHAMGITTIRGEARFLSPDSLDVEGRTVRPEAVVIAAGARPVDLGIEGQELISTSTDFLSLEAMPDEVAFIGGGYISFEFARLAQLSGAKVTIVHRSNQVLKGFDADLAAMLADRYRTLGIDLLLDAPVERVERTDEGRLQVVTPRGSVVVDAVFHGAGRVPDLGGLDLETAGVNYTPRGVEVDETLRSMSNPRVWAAGDAAAAGSPLTPVAGAQGEVVASGIVDKPRPFDDSATPSVVFSDPPLARVGMGADEAQEQAGLEVRPFDMSDWYSQTRVGNTAAAARIVVDSESGAIKGAHLLGVEADEVINIFALALRFGITLGDLATVTWSYPTVAYDINYLTGRY